MENDPSIRVQQVRPVASRIAGALVRVRAAGPAGSAAARPRPAALSAASRSRSRTACGSLPPAWPGTGCPDSAWRSNGALASACAPLAVDTGLFHGRTMRLGRQCQWPWPRIKRRWMIRCPARSGGTGTPPSHDHLQAGQAAYLCDQNSYSSGVLAPESAHADQSAARREPSMNSAASSGTFHCEK